MRAIVVVMTPSLIVLTLLAGLTTGLGLIVAIGAQNAFVLRQGIRGEHVVPIIAICAISDIALIAAGVGGLGRLIEAAPVVLQVARWVGAAALLGYAGFALRRSIRPAALNANGPDGGITRRTAVLTALALTWLNPHVYLDTVLLLGSIAAARGAAAWWFGGGAMLGSIIWFSTIGFGGRLLRSFFARPASWRVLDLVIAVIMLVMAISLAASA